MSIYCSVFGHKYQISKKITSHVKEYECNKCGKQLTTNGDGKLVALTPKRKEINATLSKIYKKKQAKLNKQ